MLLAKPPKLPTSRMFGWHQHYIIQDSLVYISAVSNVTLHQSNPRDTAWTFTVRAEDLSLIKHLIDSTVINGDFQGYLDTHNLVLVRIKEKYVEYYEDARPPSNFIKVKYV